MRSEWAYYESFLSEDECQAIIDEALKRPIMRGTVSSDNKVDKKIRHSEVLFLPRTDPVFSNVFATVDYCVDEANDQWFGVNYNRFGARSLQFTIYRGDADGGGHFYHAHQDCSLKVEGDCSQRKLSVVVQLSDPSDYDGGEFRMERVSKEPPQDSIKKRGSILIFPSLVIHGVTPVTRGIRYSLVGWYVGPPWS